MMRVDRTVRWTQVIYLCIPCPAVSGQMKQLWPKIRMVPQTLVWRCGPHCHISQVEGYAWWGPFRVNGGRGCTVYKFEVKFSDRTIVCPTNLLLLTSLSERRIHINYPEVALQIQKKQIYEIRGVDCEGHKSESLIYWRSLSSNSFQLRHIWDPSQHSH